MRLTALTCSFAGLGASGLRLHISHVGWAPSELISAVMEIMRLGTSQDDVPMQRRKGQALVHIAPPTAFGTPATLLPTL